MQQVKSPLYNPLPTLFKDVALTGSNGKAPVLNLAMAKDPIGIL
jgi:hypothetical protein